MNEDAYYKVLKAFAAGAYDLVSPKHKQPWSFEAKFKPG